MRSFIIVLIVTSLLTACGGEEETPTGDTGVDAGDTTDGGETGDTDATTDGGGLTATLSSIQTNVFTSSCALAGCHSSASAAGGLVLEDGSSFLGLVDGGRVVPDDPDNSRLIGKLEGTASGSRMPRGAAPLSDETITVIRQWISDGAADN